jgi:AAA15 family ATPase/GTPase
MILEIRLRNFFSIKDEIVLDLRAGRLKSKQAREMEQNTFQWQKEKLLKTVAIYGANASGKSNIIKAIRFCCLMILESHMHNENTKFNFMPFKFDNCQNEDSYFLIRFVSGNIEYEYSFSLSIDEIKRERLYYYPSNRRAKIFERDESLGGSKKEKYSFSSLIKRPFDVAENTSNKTLYISRASQMDREIGKEIFNFFNEKVVLRYSNLDVNVTEALINRNKAFLLRALKIADSDIIDIRVEKEKVTKKAGSYNLLTNSTGLSDKTEEVLKIKTYHRSGEKVEFDFDTEESDGTRKMFAIILRMIDIVRNDKTLIIDEIDTSLHTNIVEYFIRLFHMGYRCQLIYTSHNTSLLDLKKTRKDQVYFVNKNNKGASDFYSLFDFKDFRENMDAEKGYLQGRFDAVPFIDLSSSTLKSLLDG